mmetsp:Transcript_3680/g.7817  ORF Transcript_3680/g.7817 Transcript_3680/m.7817 type:complete len:524 (-) Transcript_3680:7-1578(-)
MNDPSNRYFVDRGSRGGANRGDAYYQRQIECLSERCWKIYENQRGNHEQVKASLYAGSLGPCCYFRYRLATSPCFHELHFSGKEKAPENYAEMAKKSCCTSPSQTERNYQLSTSSDVKKAKMDMLLDALSSANSVLHQCKINDKRQRVSFLEGEWVGATALKIAIVNALITLLGDEDEMQREMDDGKNDLIRFGENNVASNFPLHECEVLYGRAGYLKAIKFVRNELRDVNFGGTVSREIVRQIWEQGKRGAIEYRRLNDSGDEQSLPLVWKWHEKLYLGAAHGIVGILHTLLDFCGELSAVDPNALEEVESTIIKLDNFCFKSGNLQSSIKHGNSVNSTRSDRLVQFCHGAPGHVLLLLQLFRTKQQLQNLESRSKEKTKSISITQSLSNDNLSRAQQIAKCVILPRGLLRKGVGLCHGISGNAYSFISIHQTTMLGLGPGLGIQKATFNTATQKERNESDIKWIEYAYVYANFALDHLDELEDIPDRPYSMFEGLVGLICLLLGILENGAGVNHNFPCFEF